MGDQIELSGDANEGHIFKEWQVINGDVALSSATENPAFFTMPDNDVEVMTIFEEEESTGCIEILQENPLKAWVYNRNLQVSGLTAGKVRSVYNVSDMLIYRSIATSDKAEVIPPAPGIYIVVSENQSVKTVY